MGVGYKYMRHSKRDVMKKIKLKVTPNAKRNEVLEENGKFRVYVKARAITGKANKAVIETLAEFFKVKKKNVRIVSGKRSREKTVEIDVWEKLD